MKIRFSLFAKILFWFFLNLGILVSLLLVIFGQQFKIGVDSILKFDKGSRILSVMRLITQELARTDAEDWNEITDRFNSAYGVDFLVFSMEGEGQVAGKNMTLPKKVIDKTEQIRAERAADGPPPRHGERFGHPPPPDAQNGRGPPPRKHPPRFFLRTKNPSLYWFGGQIRIINQAGAPPDHFMVLIVSDQADGNGLFFDPRPWIFNTIMMAILSVIFWIPLVRNITRPLRKMTSATRRIAGGRFDVKLDDARSDEIGQLGGAINEMSSRLDGLIKGQKRFLGDVAHELASPIARIQMGLGILEQKTSDEQQQKVLNVLDEVQHMSHLVNELLSFSRAEVNPAKVQLKTLEIKPVIERVAGREGTQGITIGSNIEQGLRAYADAELLARAISNLVRNAIQYAGNEGPIDILAGNTESGVEILVRDSGPGVPDEFIGQLFEPFYRPDTSRERETGGVGLGLAIVRTCVQTCRGTVKAENLKPKGFGVTITLRANAPTQ